MLVLDIEASGLDYKESSIVSIGALDLNNPTNQFYAECKVWEGSHISDQALEVNGFTKEEVLDEAKMTEAELVRNFIDWSKTIEDDRTLAGQNVSFDRDYVQAACKRAGVEYPFAHRTIDTHTLGWMHHVNRGLKLPIDPEHKRSSLNLDALLNYCGIPDEPEPHNALTGALSHAECISRILYSKKLLPEFEKFDIPWKIK
jgi:DNA polymerase III epsilon subunit-like protein